jgi:hypothetical protein
MTIPALDYLINGFYCNGSDLLYNAAHNVVTQVWGRTCI